MRFSRYPVLCRKKSSFAYHTWIHCPRIDRRGKPCKVRLHQTSQFQVFCLEGSAESLGTCKAGTGIRESNKNAAGVHILGSEVGRNRALWYLFYNIISRFYQFQKTLNTAGLLP